MGKEFELIFYVVPIQQITAKDLIIDSSTQDEQFEKSNPFFPPKDLNISPSPNLIPFLNKRPK